MLRSMTVHEMTASQLLDALAAGELTSVEAVEAPGKRRRDVDPMVNALVHLGETALGEAREADAERARGELRGPLHGLPITIKDNIAVAGTDATLGMQARRGHPDREDAVLVAELRRLGAIVIGKTNVPQLLLAQETENRLFGVTHNPFHLGHVPRGSSGGDAAAAASGRGRSCAANSRSPGRVFRRARSERPRARIARRAARDRPRRAGPRRGPHSSRPPRMRGT